jgi:hypothetical protein
MKLIVPFIVAPFLLTHAKGQTRNMNINSLSLRAEVAVEEFAKCISISGASQVSNKIMHRLYSPLSSLS